MKRTDVARRICGGMLLLLGGVVMLGWLVEEPGLVRLRPSYPAMVLNSAVGFVLAGLGLLFGFEGSPRARPVRTVTGVLLAAITLTTLLEHAAGWDLGVDWIAAHRWLRAGASTTGRMSIASSLAFLAAGSFLIVSAHAHGRAAGIALRMLSIVVGVIGALAVAGYAVDAPLLFPGYYFSGIAAHTAAGLILLSVGLRLSLEKMPWARERIFASEDDRISAVAVAVLALVASIAGVASFSLLQGRAQAVIAESLQSSLVQRSEQIQDLLGMRSSSARIAASRPAIINNLRAVQAGKDNGANIANMQAVVASFLKEGFSAFAYQGLDGKAIASGGRFIEAPDVAIPLEMPGRPELLWEDGFVLRHHLPMGDAQGQVGTLVAEQPLPVLTRLSRHLEGLGRTGDMGLCARKGATQLVCFPQRLNARVFVTPLANTAGEELPMTRALKGERGLIVTRDYRDQTVLAAFAPIGNVGLGMVVKIDTAEVFMPIREQLQVVAIVLVALIAAGTLLLRSQVRPLTTALRESRDELRNAMTSEIEAQRAALHRAQVLAGLAHVITGAHGQVEGSSQTLPALIGRPAAQLPKSTREWLELIEPADREDFRATAIRAGELGVRQDIEYRLRRGDGRVIDLRQVIEPIPGPDGNPSGRWFSTLQDVTEHKRAEAAMRHLNADLERRVADRTAELKAANQELESFSYTVSHDLRAPLRAIEGFSRILEQEHAEMLPEASRHLLARVHHNVALMSRLIEDLLQFSRLGRQDLNRSAVLLTTVVEECLAELRDAIAERKVHLRVGELPIVHADAQLMGRVFENLLSNAVKYSRNAAAPFVEVGSITHDGETAIYVRDNGVGFDMRYAHKLFNVFQRLHSASEFEGTGVGLAIVQRIVQRHGGRVWAEARPGEGATFYFTLGAASTIGRSAL
jgi:PAS domain S-box-containing protein